MKAIAIDVDETIGSFQTCAKICHDLYGNKLSQSKFNDVMETHPHILRPGILEIFEYIHFKQQTIPCKVYLFTNNQGGPEWIEYIKNYIHLKLHYKIIDQVILSQLFEPKRQYSSKTLSDFHACTHILPKTPIFFIDDQYHPGMHVHPVYYFHIYPYSIGKQNSPIKDLAHHLNIFLNRD